jgi:hypothetical protein
MYMVASSRLLLRQHGHPKPTMLQSSPLGAQRKGLVYLDFVLLAVGVVNTEHVSVVQVNEEETNLNAGVVEYVNNVTTPYKSKFAPSQMHQLALVAHNHMKPAMATFIKTYSEILKKFRITGTQATMLMCKQLWGEDNNNNNNNLRN